MFRRLKGKTKIMYFKHDTSTEVRNGSLVQLNDSGVRYAKNDSTDRIIGVSQINDTLSDTTVEIPVEVPVENGVEWEIDVDSDAGAVASSILGHYIAIDTVGGASVNAGDSCAMRVNVDDTAAPMIFVTGVISTTKIRGVIARSAFIAAGATKDTLDTGA